VDRTEKLSQNSRLYNLRVVSFTIMSANRKIKTYSISLKNSQFSILLIVLMSACVDRIDFDTGITTSFPIVIEGGISDQLGPYKVRISKAYDIESKYSIKTPIDVSNVSISDGHGTIENLTRSDAGEYSSSIDGIRGVIGEAYSVRVELRDGRIYESIPDTLYEAGSIDSVYYNFIETKGVDDVSNYGFDLFFNSTSGNRKDYYFLWKFTGTFRADTNPELGNPLRDGCQRYNGKCNWLPICTGLLNVASPDYPPSFERIAPCTCCRCWYNIYNEKLLLSDSYLTRLGRFTGVKLATVPLNGWIFQDKLRVEISQLSLSRDAFLFWKSIKDQKDAVNSLFQPVTGKIVSNFKQLTGATSPVYGFFYSSSQSAKSLFISKQDVPNVNLIPAIPVSTESCLSLFPNSTTERPLFWID